MTAIHVFIHSGSVCEAATGCQAWGWGDRRDKWNSAPALTSQWGFYITPDPSSSKLSWS